MGYYQKEEIEIYENIKDHYLKYYWDIKPKKVI